MSLKGTPWENGAGYRPGSSDIAYRDIGVIQVCPVCGVDFEVSGNFDTVVHVPTGTLLIANHWDPRNPKAICPASRQPLELFVSKGLFREEMEKIITELEAML